MFISNIKIGAVLRQYATIIVANFSIFFLGLEVSWASPVLVKLRDANQTDLSRSITEEEGSWIVSAAALPGIVVIFFTGFLIDRLGRKKCIILAILPRIVMCVLLIFGREVWTILLAKAISGPSDMLCLTVVPTYASEIASKDIRGALGTITQILSAFGMLIMLSIGPFVSFFTLNLVLLGFIVLLSIPQLFLPESPYYLYIKGQKEEALKVLKFLRNSEEVAREEMKQYEMNNENSTTKIEILKDRVILKTIGKVIFIGISFQMVGYNAMSTYLQTILESTRTSLTPESCSVVIGCIQLLASICTIFLTDRYGRKPILITTLIGMTIGMAGLGIFFKLTEEQQQVTGFLNFLPIISMLLIIYCFNAGMGSITLMLVAELFEGPARAIGVSSAVFSTTVFIFLTIKYFAAFTRIVGPAVTYWMFSFNCIVTCLFIAFFIPETKGRTFAEIQEALGKKTDGHPESKPAS